MRKLFVSFTETLAQMRSGQVKPHDFDQGLFYFGCIRAHALDPWNCPKPRPDQDWPTSNEVTWFYQDKPELGRQVHGILKKALRKAEREGRVAWRKRGQSNSFAQLNTLFRRNGLKCLDEAIYWTGDYTYPAVVDAVASEKLPIEVVYRS